MIELPTLYAKAKDGKILQWSVRADGDVVVMENGKVGGKQNVTRTRSKPTNVGRSNERLGPAQAQFEAQAAWTKKIDEGYFESIDAAKNTVVYLPMLAQPLFKRATRKGQKVDVKANLFFPCHVQRKLNGARGLSTADSIVSRQGSTWNLRHVQEQIGLLIGKGEMLDGEVYVHGMPLQNIMSLIKDYRPESSILRYHVYDMPKVNGDESLPWESRFLELTVRHEHYLKKCKQAGLVPCIDLVETLLVRDEDEVKAIEKVAVELEGYEGLILRRLDGPYRFNDRCDSLIKYKRFQDAEFVVQDVVPRELIKTGRTFTICDKFVCRNNLNDETFECVPRGSEVEREGFWKNREEYIGKRLTVRFLERSVDGIPIGNPVGLGFRDPDDTPEEEKEMWE